MNEIDNISSIRLRLKKWGLNTGGSWVNVPLRELRAAISVIDDQEKIICALVVGLEHIADVDPDSGTAHFHAVADELLKSAAR